MTPVAVLRFGYQVVDFLPARRYDSAVIACPSVRQSVCHKPVLHETAKRGMSKTTPHESPGTLNGVRKKVPLYFCR